MNNIINLQEYKDKQKQKSLEKLDPNAIIDNASIVQAIGLLYNTLCTIPVDVVNNNKYTNADLNDLVDIDREIKEILYKKKR